MSFKDIFNLKLWWPLCWAERNHLCIFGRGHHEEHFCKNNLEFGAVMQEMLFKHISRLATEEIWLNYISYLNLW